MGQQLGWYVTDAQAILNDRFSMFTPRTQLIRWINQGRKQAAKVSKCIQIVVPGIAPQGASSAVGSGLPGGMAPGADPQNQFFTQVGVERYPYSLANQFVRQQNTGVDSVLDVVQVAISWSSAMRPALDWYPWDDFQAYFRSYQNLLASYPAVWSTTGDAENGSVWLYPSPSVATEMEWLTACSPKFIYTDNDYDALPNPFTDAVKYWAARMAYLGSQRFAQAKEMADEFYHHIGVDRAAVDGGKVSSYYTTAFG